MPRDQFADISAVGKLRDIPCGGASIVSADDILAFDVRFRLESAATTPTPPHNSAAPALKLVTFQDSQLSPRVGAVVGDCVIDLSEAIEALDFMPAQRAALTVRGLSHLSGMLRFLWTGQAGLATIARTAAERSTNARKHGRLLSEVQLLAPVPRPGKIVAIGRNYADHAKETGVQPFEKPRIIAKLPSSVCAPGTCVRKPRSVNKLDFEAELGVVIGALASNVPRERAYEVVAGYTVLNDLSAREFQFDVAPPQTTFAKSMDGFCPMGPWLVTKDEIANPQRLDIKSSVNGTPMQHGNSADMLFPIDRIIEFLSEFMTLEPGDVIATGTPAGSGAFRDPPVWLQPGDHVRIEIDQVGVLEHEIG